MQHTDQLISQLKASGRLTTDPSTAAQWLKEGKLLCYPTESVWGLGCDPAQPEAFEALLHAKLRPADKGVILIAAEPSHLSPWVSFTSEQQARQAQSLWENQSSCATTLLIKASSQLPKWIKGSHSTVAVRLTPHPLCRELCSVFGGALVSSSANLAGQLPAKTLEQAHHYFKDKVHYLLGDTLGFETPSQIIELSSLKRLR